MFWLWGRPPADSQAWRRAVTGPFGIDAILESASGAPLVQERAISAVVVVPARMAPWARLKLPETLARKPEGLWLSPPPAWLGSRIAGVHTVKVQILQPLNGLSPRYLTIAAQETGRYGPLVFRPSISGKTWAAATKAPVRLALSLGLSRALSKTLGAGGSVLAVTGQGQIVALASNPWGRGIFWRPHPAGLALVPPLLAEALDHPEIFSGLSVSDGPRLLELVAKRWGASAIAQALDRAGIGKGSSLIGQPAANPPLAHPATTLMTSGQALWVTPEEVARAYIPFIDNGLTPMLTAGGAVSPTVAANRPLLATPSSLALVRETLPVLIAGGIRFRVWRPDSNFAVALTRTHGGLVVVAEGPADRQIPWIIQDAAHWLKGSSP